MIKLNDVNIIGNYEHLPILENIKNETVYELRPGDDMPDDDRMVHTHEDIDAYSDGIPYRWKKT